MSYRASFHQASLLPLILALAVGAAAGRATAQTDLEARIVEKSELIERYNAEIVRLRNSVAGIGDSHRQSLTSDIVAVQDRIRAAIAKHRDAQLRIEEHTSRCDVVVAQRNGLPVTPSSLAMHNRDLAEARMALAEAQKDEQTHRVQLGALQEKAGGMPPAEAAVNAEIVRLTAEVRNHEAALFSLRSQRSQQELQATIRRSVEELTRPGRPVAAPAVAVAPVAAKAADASTRSIEARRTLADLARRAIGEAEAAAPPVDLLDALPPRPKPATVVVPPAPAAETASAIDVEDLLSRLPARAPSQPLAPPKTAPAPTPASAPAPAPAAGTARPTSGGTFGLDALKRDASGGRAP